MFIRGEIKGVDATVDDRHDIEQFSDAELTAILRKRVKVVPIESDEQRPEDEPLNSHPSAPFFFTPTARIGGVAERLQRAKRLASGLNAERGRQNKGSVTPDQRFREDD